MRVDKIRRIGGSLFGMCGGAFEGLVLLRWLAGPRKAPPKWPSDFSQDEVFLLELSAEGLAVWNGWGIRMAIHDPFYSIGSGCLAAMAAMHAGATPEKAVHIAAEFDEGTAAPVHVFKLADLAKYPDERKRSRK